MSLPYLSPVHVFGIKGNARNNIHFLDANNVAYIAGANLVIYNIDTKIQRFAALGLCSF